jgi:ATP/maltotriose-dependent transcriptional regulator MalT
LAKHNTTKAFFHAKRALEIRRSLFGSKNAEVAKDLYYLGSVYANAEKIKYANKFLEEAASIFREVDPGNPNLPYLLEDLGANYSGLLKDNEKAEPYLTESLELFRKKTGENSWDTARLYLDLAKLFARKGDIEKAEEYFHGYENRLNQLPDENLRKQFVVSKADFEETKGNNREAENMLENFLLQTVEKPDTPIVGEVLATLKQFYTRDKNYERLAEIEIKRLEIWKQKLPRDEIEIALGNLTVAAVLYRIGKANEAKTYFDEGFPVYKTSTADSVYKGKLDRYVGECFYHQKRYAEAKPLLQLTASFYSENFPPSDENREMYKDLLDKTEAALKE